MRGRRKSSSPKLSYLPAKVCLKVNGVHFFWKRLDSIGGCAKDLRLNSKINRAHTIYATIVKKKRLFLSRTFLNVRFDFVDFHQL